MSFRFYGIGAWLWIITGVTHTLFDLLSRLFPSAAKEPVRTALHNLPFEFLGMSSDYYRLTMGFSLAMGTSIALVGVLFLLIARLTAGAAARTRPVCLVGLAASLGLLAISITALQLPPPMITFALASLAFATALFTSARSSASDA
jgi:hypothetical protein